MLLQPRLQADLAGWQVRGDVDVLRLERDADGQLHPLIADIKSSTAAKVEHRLQVAFYHDMLAALFAREGIAHGPITLAVLYRGPAATTVTLGAGEAARQEVQRAEAERWFGTGDGFLEVVDDPDAYLGAVRDLVTGPLSTARRVIQTEFDDVPFHLTYKCDGCLYNEFCMKRSAETDDLSLLPHLTEQDKRGLQRAGITTVRDLAALKDLRRTGHVNVAGEVQEWTTLVPAPGREAESRRLAATWPVGQRLDELVHRARRYRRWKKDDVAALTYIPSKGYGSLPHSDATQNPNLVRVYVDAQHDYLHDRLYLLGALVVGSEGGAEPPGRRRSVVRLSDGPPDSSEREERLLVDWIGAALRAIAEIAAPDEEGRPRAPIHLVFVDGFAQRVLLEGLARHASTILGATALYDFMTQIAAFDSPLTSFLDREVRDQKNYPMVCQSLQAVAAFLGFDWNAGGVPYRDLFRARLFDFWGKLDTPGDPEAETPGIAGWYTNRARFNSQIPLEFAYAAWGELPPPHSGRDEMEPYRESTPDLLAGFHARRLEAMERVAKDFAGNRQTAQTAFDLPDLATFEQKARTLAHALDEFVTIERHVELSAWKRERLAPPEQRVLAGQTLVVRYLEEDQEPGVAEVNRENEVRRHIRDAYRAAFKDANPAAKQVRLSKEQKAESDWSQEGMRFRLRLECADVACELDEVLGLTTLKPGDWLVLYPRVTFDGRPGAAQVPFTPTAKQMLYGMRAELDRITVRREGGRAVEAFAEVVMKRPMGGKATRGFVFGTIEEKPLTAGDRYTLDPDPNNIYGLWSAQVAEGLVAGGENTLYALLAGMERPLPLWPEEGAAGQTQFLAGLDALREAGALHGFEPSKRDFIGGHGTAPLLLVQGPPGTGKSYSTAFALFARLQGAMAADQPFRVFITCKTHAATDVLLENVVRVRDMLRGFATAHPEIFAAHFDRRLLDVPLFRLRPRGEVANGVIPLPKDDAREAGRPKAVESILAQRWAVVAATPGGTNGLIKERWGKDVFGHHLADCLVLDEASQMNLPEAAMAALPLAPDGRIVVVGDHRQMPPIVKHEWASEPRRSFQEFRAFESLFLTLLPLAPPMIKFEESFRLHADMAEFLRREVYAQDGIAYHSRRREVLGAWPTTDDFVAAVLTPDHPLVVVVHDEAASQVRNAFEQRLVTPILAALADPAGYGLDPEKGLGVVVPHRAQRAALQEEVPGLTVVDPATGAILVSAVDTVERFQGGERTVILVGATESDREYLLVSGKFLLDPRRLTVALSRAKRKMVLVAARSVFEVFSADEETFANAQLWKNLLRRTCTVPLWAGERDGQRVEVWGNPSGDRGA
ncbi:MAG: AAA domain-containing protein [Thermomicrobiales bacterium]